ncbi:MAG: hypothetical protein HQK66_08515 [Desulfamplus sp.]|nr:hypothetical protein [Desulfamplus sp.]
MTENCQNSIPSRVTLKDLLMQKNVPVSRPAQDNGQEGFNRNCSCDQYSCDQEIASHRLMQITDTLFKRGVAALKDDRPCCARGFFETLLAVEPDHIKARLNLSVALSRMGDHKGARTVLEGVLVNEPDNAIALQNLEVLDSIGF